eukprot:134561-Rhodomonas_salina.1
MAYLTIGHRIAGVKAESGLDHLVGDVVDDVVVLEQLENRRLLCKSRASHRKHLGKSTWRAFAHCDENQRGRYLTMRYML